MKLTNWQRFDVDTVYLRDESFDLHELKKRESFAIVATDGKNKFKLITYNKNSILVEESLGNKRTCSDFNVLWFIKLDPVYLRKSKKHACVDLYCHDCYMVQLRCLNLNHLFRRDVNINNIDFKGQYEEF